MTAGALLAVGHGTLLQAAGFVAGLPVLDTLLGGAASPSPSPSPSTVEIPPEDQTSPGFLGFLVTFGVAVAVIVLGFSLVRHLRVVERARRREEADEAASAAAAGPDEEPATASAGPDEEPATASAGEAQDDVGAPGSGSGAPGPAGSGPGAPDGDVPGDQPRGAR